MRPSGRRGAQMWKTSIWTDNSMNKGPQGSGLPRAGVEGIDVQKE